MSPPFDAPAEPRAIGALLGRAAAYEVLRWERGAVVATLYGSQEPMLRAVLGEALDVARDLMHSQKRALSELLQHEYSLCEIRAYARADARTGVMAPIGGVYRLGDLADFMRREGLNFDAVLDDPLLLAPCVTARAGASVA